ncbi:hypothetical protein A4G99_16600 [Haladaptatus sp. R4]|uniref:signal peptidase I n=1 Tax=Haladaptatus sp. R4 TaxID=1679489 RepID=UPI0007B461AC|nr:signal peptidase I [Haladaptatus sp. R4]KZN23117.1 hypothetical protein A4G99_16600 [Haladaptatus sp. R4]
MTDLRAILSRIVIFVLLAPLILQITFVLVPGFGSYSVLSGSMEPTIHTGSLVYTKDTGDYTTGDIITFVVAGDTVTHRIVDKTPEGFITKGETQKQDSWRITPDQIRGEYLFSIPLYGYLIRPFSSVGMALYAVLGGGGILYIVGQEIFNRSES